jgi:AcrR family transcriptional regulator
MARPPITPEAARASKESWAEAALRALTEGGVEAVAVEPLARGLGVTKGSFYWHFENREALLVAALELWEARGTTAIVDELSAIASPAERLRSLFRRVSDVAKGAPSHAALASSHEPLVQRTLKRVATTRLSFLTECYEQLGLSPKPARRRALLAYAAYLGIMQVIRESPGELGTAADRDAYTAHVIETLVPRG